MDPQTSSPVTLMSFNTVAPHHLHSSLVIYIYITVTGLTYTLHSLLNIQEGTFIIATIINALQMLQKI